MSDNNFLHKRANLSQMLVGCENELYKIQKEIERLKLRESELINEIQTLEDVLGINEFGRTGRRLPDL